MIDTSAVAITVVVSSVFSRSDLNSALLSRTFFISCDELVVQLESDFLGTSGPATDGASIKRFPSRPDGKRGVLGGACNDELVLGYSLFRVSVYTFSYRDMLVIVLGKLAKHSMSPNIHSHIRIRNHI